MTRNISHRSRILPTAVLAIVMGLNGTPALADGAGAFLGGMITSKVLTNMQQRTRAEQYAAYSQPKTVVVHDSAGSSGSGGSSTKSVEERLDQLDKLAAGGYITPEEYKRKKQQILDSL